MKHESTTPVFEALLVLNAKKDIYRAFRMYRTAQLKKSLNRGAKYYGGETRWLRDRIAFYQAKENAIEKEIQEALNDGNDLK